MKKIMVLIMFLGLATTAFAQRGGSRGGGGRSMSAGGGRSFSGGGGRSYSGGFSGRGSNVRGYGGGYGYGGGFRGGYGYRASGFGVGFYGSPWAYGPGYYPPYCDPAWGPCYYPPSYGYGRPAIGVSIGVGRGVVVGGGWQRFGRR